MHYVGAFSAEMRDLFKEQERQALLLFAGNFFAAIENRIPTSKTYKPLTYGNFEYIPGSPENKIDSGGKKIIILTDCEDKQTNLGRMIGRFKQPFDNDAEVINIKGGCLGCLQCGYDNTCTYKDRDEFMEFYNSKLKSADVLILAGRIQDRYLSSRWKMFFDRSFFNTHIPSLRGKQLGLIISGPLSQIPNLRQIFEAYTEWQQANLVDFISDEYEDSTEIDALLQSLARRLIHFADQKYIKPATFLGVGGMKIFRDDIWGRLRFPFQADHKFYKEHGLYDFPQKNYPARITSGILMLLTKIPSIRKKIYVKRMKGEMIKPFQKLLK